MNLFSRYTIFSTPFVWLRIFLLTILFSLILAYTLSYLVTFPFSSLFLKCLIDSTLLLALAVLLERIIPSSNYVKLDLTQRVVNYLALAIFIIAIWVSLTYLSSLVIFGKDKSAEVIKLIPVTALIGLLIFLIVVQNIQYKNSKRNGDNDNGDETLEEETMSNENQNNNSNSNENERVFLERITIKIGQKINVILVPDIVYIKSDGDYVHVFTDKGKYIKEDTMKYFESNLHPHKFVRVHRSSIVNVEKIARIELYEKNNHMLILKNGSQIKASIAGYKLLRGVLNL